MLPEGWKEYCLFTFSVIFLLIVFFCSTSCGFTEESDITTVQYPHFISNNLTEDNCGDGFCDLMAGENYDNCLDCVDPLTGLPNYSYCGDGFCDSANGETIMNCWQDCKPYERNYEENPIINPGYKCPGPF
jgi:hypothetical protein